MLKCKQCGRCCKYLVFQISSDFDKDLKQYFETRGFEVLPEKNILIQYNPCPHLKNNKCSIHDHKPELCRRFDSEHLEDVIVLKGCVFEEHAQPYQILEIPKSLEKD